MDGIKPPANEVFVGLEEYKSKTPGIGGVIKDAPEDFIVCEITPDGKVIKLEGDEEGDMLLGDYTHFTLVKRNWDTMRAITVLSNMVGVSRNRFAFAGTKDKKAITAQRVSAYKVPVEKLKSVRMAEITLKDFSYADENLGLGSLWGNRFRINVRNISDGTGERISDIAEELKGGFPNYYGMQRFGEVRPITHEVGRHILAGDFEAAVMCYLSKSFECENELTKLARDELAEKRDFKRGFEEFPKSLGYEKAMLNHLIEKDGDWVGALKTLPKNLQKMFVHAYQSYVFNRALSRCIRENISVDVLPLVGSEVEADVFSAGILEKEGVSVKDFRVEGMSELRSKGTHRQCFTEADELSWNISANVCEFSFSLQKGAYATVFLREFMKN